MKLTPWPFFLILAAYTGNLIAQTEFSSNWEESLTRTWIGENYWANRLQDWRISIGRLESLQQEADLPMRTVHLLTHSLSDRQQPFRLNVRTGLIGYPPESEGSSWSGFLIGAGEQGLDYRAASLVHHYSGKGGGLIAALDDTGLLIFRSNEDSEARDSYPLLDAVVREGDPIPRGGRTDNWEDIQLEVRAVPNGDSTYRIVLSAWDYFTGNLLQKATLASYPSELLTGNVALVSHSLDYFPAKRYWFRDFGISGDKFDAHADRSFGPILNAMYSLDQDHLRMNVQLPPLGFGDEDKLSLLIRSKDGSAWEPIQERTIDPLSFTALFEIPDWNGNRPTDYGFRYQGRDYPWGTIAKNPKTEPFFKIATINCYQIMGRPADDSWGYGYAGQSSARWGKENIWFPNPISHAIASEEPHLLAFLGDQLYESGNPTGSDVRGKNPKLDYFYKWYLFLWNFNGLMKNRPTVGLVDDHDVYQGDLWGAGGVPSKDGNNKTGGYTMDPAFVKMVETTQAAQNPNKQEDPLLKQGLKSNYGTFTYGHIGFAYLEDRKFKSLPTVIKNVAKNGSKIADKDFRADQARFPGLTLYGKNQMEFLDRWVARWDGEEYMKIAFSQTMLASLHTDPEGYKWMDLDSGGWPQSSRDSVLRIFRKGHVPIIGGDTHLPAVVQHGIDGFNDGAYQFVGPPASNKYRRWWNPQPKSAESYQGEHTDGFENKVTAHAIGNPYISQKEVFTQNKTLERGYGSEHIYLDPTKTKDGYGLIVLDKEKGTITFEAKDKQGKIHPEWPITISIEDNYQNKGTYVLPKLNLRKFDNPLVKVIDSTTGELLYNFRAFDQKTVRLHVPRLQLYEVIVYDFASKKEMVFKDQQSTLAD